MFCKSPGHAEFEMSMIFIVPSILAEIIDNQYKVGKKGVVDLTTEFFTTEFFTTENFGGEKFYKVKIFGSEINCR